MIALPTVVLAMVALIPGLWFFLLIALPVWFLGLLATVPVMRSEGIYAGLGVLAGLGLGAIAFCAAIYVNLHGVFGT